MSRFRVITSIALACAAVFALAGPTSAAPTADTLTVYMKQDQREVLDIGASGPTIGDVVTGSGPVSRTNGGTAIGSVVYRAETVRVNIPGGVESRLSTLWVTLPKGSIAATSLVSVPQGTRPVAVQQFVIVGGTGAYAGVRGTMGFKPLSADDYRLTYRFVD